jgi:predicted enzyme related to lactoylglutathione lyase
MNPLVYFEIPVADMKRACLFYERVFEVSLELREIDGNEMALFPHAEGAPGASGALARGESYVPGKAGARIYFGVSDVAATLHLAVSAGGAVNYPVTEVPGYGVVAEFIDTEGNCSG